MNDSGYYLKPDGYFVIENYNDKRAFSNFLPGIAGLLGTPMWAFYVNRGQCMASFGIRNKDQAILEFFPANKAYQQTSRLGFRTFIKCGDKTHEPFQPVPEMLRGRVVQSLEMASHEFVLQEIYRELGLQFTVRYFTVPGEPIAALARELTVTNISKSVHEVELLDGMPALQPFGMNEFLVKQMSRTIEAWMIVENLGKNAPYFRLRVDPTDRPELEEIHGGNFYFSTSAEGRGTLPLLDMVVDPQRVFGPVNDFSFPKPFFETQSFRSAGQIGENKTPCAFSHAKFRLKPGQSKTVFSYCGHAQSVEHLNRYVLKARKAGYFREKQAENKTLTESIKSSAFTVSRSEVFDQYASQTFLDNVLRGGLPVTLGPKEKPLVFYAYSRKHGDLERDYNRFLVEPAYFSQGDGNYRDVNQNRRNDVWFSPAVKDANIKAFLNLIQLDGNNPLVVKGVVFRLKRNAESLKLINGWLGSKNAKEFLAWVDGHAFTLGELCRFLDNQRMLPVAKLERFLGELSASLEAEQNAEHGEGYWIDHWTYNLDLIESYLAIYPEKLEELLFADESYTFFDNDHVLRPRHEKYFLKNAQSVRQYRSVAADAEKKLLIQKRGKQKHVSRVRAGIGEPLTTNLFVKLLFLFTAKFTALDPSGTGIEMESDKPGWLDALNGLPGLLGSSTCETFELKRLALFMIHALEEIQPQADAAVSMPVELSELLEKLDGLVSAYFKNQAASKDFDIWERISALKETYREAIRKGVSGREKKIALTWIKLFLEHAREKIEIGLEKSYDEKTRLYPTYFENEVIKHKTIGENGNSRAKALATRQKPLPLFLEGIVHALKVEKDPAQRRSLVRAVRASALYDKKLSMYKLNVPLNDTSMEIGRAKVFLPGWLENESVWLHMEYKFLLELLRNGLAEEFYQDFKKALVPFQDPERYGRSILENSSFIASSAFMDPQIHGTGFVARLSGSTAEFLHMWLLMNVGKRPFSLGPDGKLSLRFEPNLPAFLFTTAPAERVRVKSDGSEETVKIPANALAFLFLGKTLVVYKNPKKLDTYGNVRVSVKKITITLSSGRTIEFKGDTIPSPYSSKVRDEFIPRIDIELG